MLKKLMILLSCFSLVMLGACGSEDLDTSATHDELGAIDKSILDETEDVDGNPVYEGEAEDISLITSPDNGSMLEKEAEEGNPAYEGEIEDISLVTSTDHGEIEAEEKAH